MRAGTPHGAASLQIAPGVAFLREEDVVLQAMLDGWTAQMVGGRGLRRQSAKSVVAMVTRFQEHSNEWPWNWTSAMFDEWMADLVSARQLAPSTIRSYQQAVRAFCGYLCSPHYGWDAECETRFGSHPSQICHDENTNRHLQGYEGSPGRRPLTRDELQQFLDRVDGEVESRLGLGRKGALLAYRDATLFKVMYGWGLRANEAAHLELTDFYRNPSAAEFNGFGMLHVRFGKASRGGPPKRRSVATVFGWAVEALEDYLVNVRPLLKGAETSGLLWLTERGTRLQARDIPGRFPIYRDALGLEESLTPHSLRHSYVTHLIEDGADPVFIQQQVGHAYQSTTGIYTAVSADFMNKMMRQAIDAVVRNATEGEAAQ